MGGKPKVLPSTAKKKSAKQPSWQPQKTALITGATSGILCILCVKGGVPMETSVVTVKGQIVVPVNIRRKFGIKKGMKIAFIEQEGKLIIRPLDKSYFESLAGILGTEGKILKSLKGDKKREREL